MKSKALLAALISMALCMATVVPAWAASPAQGDSLTGATIDTQAAVAEQASQDGAWKINKKTGAYVTKAEKKLFKKALKGYTGVTYKPIFVMASQVVAGMKYEYFCQATTVTPKPKTSWKVVVIFKDTKGKATVEGISSFNYKKISTLKNAPADPGDPKYCATGAWTNNSKKFSSKGIPSAAKSAFDKATADYVGVDLTPLVLLSSQTVAGKNYRYLCSGVVPGTDSVNFYAVDVYKDTKGAAKITSCKVVNVAKYRTFKTK